MRGSREISLMPSLHRASTDSLIYIYRYTDPSVLLLACLIRKVWHIGYVGTLFHCSFTLVGNNYSMRLLFYASTSGVQVNANRGGQVRRHYVCG